MTLGPEELEQLRALRDSLASLLPDPGDPTRSIERLHAQVCQELHEWEMRARPTTQPLDEGLRLKRLASHTLLDGLVALEGKPVGDQTREAFLTALERLDSEQIIGVGVRDDGTPFVDLDPFVFGAVELLTWLVNNLARVGGVTYDEVLTDLRQQLHDHETR